MSIQTGSIVRQSDPTTQTQLDSLVRFRRITSAVLQPISPSAHWSALAAYANELADLYGFNPPTHAASGRRVS